MAVKSNVTILNVDPLGIVKVKVASGVVFAEGDLTDFDGTDLAAHGGDNSTFLGVALEGSESGDTHQISVATRCIIEALITTNAGVLGDAFKYSAGSNGVNWVLDKATSEGIAWVYENNIAVSTKGLLLIDSHVLGAGFLFDPATEG